MKKSIILLLLLALFSTYSYSQGCIMIRSINGFGQYNGLNNSFTNSEWQITVSSRYYSSNKNYFEGEDFTRQKKIRRLIVCLLQRLQWHQAIKKRMVL